MASSSFLKKRRLISKAAYYAIDTLEKRQLLCALHSGGDESLGTFPAPEPSVVETAAQSLSSGPLEVSPLTALPQLSSRVTATRKIFLDFNGANIPTWGTNNALVPPAPYTPGAIPAYTADADATTYSDAELSYITQVWQNVAEKFSPFDVDVTTVDPGNRTDGLTMACVIGGTNSWYGSGGGVAYVNSFTDTRDNTCFVWSQGSGTNINFMGAGAAHELGHAFGLEHQGVTTNGTVTSEYWSGSGQIVPIMGNANNVPSRRGIWYNGQANNRDNAAGTLQSLGSQDDLSIIGDGHNNFGFRSDDFNQASNNPTSFVNDGQGNLSAAGVINVQFDADGFKFTAGGPAASFTVTNAAQGGMLSPRAELVTYPGNVAVSASVTVSADGNSVTVATANLTPGLQYALNVHGDFTYGSVGQYTVTGTIQTFAYAQGGVLYVNGFENVADFISLDYRIVGGFAKIYVENQINGIAAQTTSVLIPINDANSIVISTKSGHDYVYFLNPIGTVFGYVPASVDMGSDINNLELRGSSAANTFWIGGGTADYLGEAITYNDTVTALTCRGYAGDDTFIVTGSGYTNVAIYGGDNNDTASITNTVVGAGSNFITFLGENGTDTMIVGDGSATGARSFTAGTGFIAGTGSITTSISGSPPRTLQNQTTEIIRLIGSENGDDFHVNYTPVGQVVKAEGYGGDDVINVGSAAKPFSQDVRGQVDALGGTGDDLVVVDDSTWSSVGTYAIQFGRVANNFVANLVTMDIPVETLEFRGRNAASTTYTAPAFTSPGVVRNFRFIEAAGAGTGSFLIDDRPVISQLFAIELYSDRMIRKFENGASFIASTIEFSGYESIGIYAANITHDIKVYGTSPDVPSGQQTSLIMGSGADIATLYPHDDQGNLTFNTNLGIGGGGGADQLIVDDTASSLPITYQFTNTFGAGTQNIYGMGSPGGFGAGSDVESIIVNAGSGDDVFNVDQFKSPVSLTVNAGEGNDAMNFGGNYLPVNITAPATFSFNGQDGNDQFTLVNTFDNGLWTYTRNINSLNVIRTGYNGVTINDSNCELMTIDAGPSADVFYVRSVGPGTSTVVNANGGSDTMLLADNTQNLSSVQGLVSYNAGAGGGNLYAYDNADSSGDTAHLNADTLGALPGDNLFGTGGSLMFSGLTTVGSFPGITLNLGSGADTIYAAPLASARVTINGNNPTTAGGDFIGMALANVTSPVFTPGVSGAGTWTSADHQALNYTGFETTTSDDTAPAGTINGFDFDSGVPMNITAQFSEDLSGTLNSNYMALTSPETGAIPSTDISSGFDTNTNIGTATFPNYAGGALPDGNFTFTILASLPDVAGNQMGSDISTSFWWLNADATRDRIVDTQDFNALAGNFGEGTIFSQGDFNFDATIDSIDFDLLIAQYGKRLPEASAARSTNQASSRLAAATWMSTTATSELFSPTAIGFETDDELMTV